MKGKIWHSQKTGNWVLDIINKTTGKIMLRYVLGNTEKEIERRKKALNGARLTNFY